MDRAIIAVRAFAASASCRAMEPATKRSFLTVPLFQLMGRPLSQTDRRDKYAKWRGAWQNLSPELTNVFDGLCVTLVSYTLL